MPFGHGVREWRGHRARHSCGVLACALLGAAFLSSPCLAQALTSSMLVPSIGGFAPVQNSPLRPVDDRDVTGSAPGAYGNPAASGAAGTGYDSLNRRRRTKPYPGTPKPRFVGPGNPQNPPPLQAPRVTAPVSPSFAGTADGAPPRRRLKIDDDPFGQVGNYVGGFLVKEAVEVSGGYDSNPGRFSQPRGSAIYRVAPELQATSDWSRHALSLDLRGSFTGYGTEFPGQTSSPLNLDRPNVDGKLAGRIDVTRDTRINSALRLRVATDNPGSPDVQVGLSKYPVYTNFGGTVGVEQDFNRLQLQVNGNADRTVYQYSKLTDGRSSSNDDRNFNQYGAQARFSYDWMPGVKPFAEVEGDTRVHDLQFDRNGYQRDSNGAYVKAGTSFEFSRLLTGEIAAGYSWRDYQDPRLKQLSGLLTSASLVWTATGLTTVKFDATSSINETTLEGVSGSLSRDYSVQVDHAFRRWLIGTARFGYGTTDYEGTRFDRRYFAEADLVYKLSRTLAIKGTLRRDWLKSDAPGVNSAETVVMLGVRVQR
ncbi:outer membrane beta-barrel protein [[Pseudomonas] carboxydohydrogena]|uniref:outer membrane beta-barrel protein n=1 Tax=Afipia carboxydohydrogena TaxID=290 RepID=UPI0023B157C0|nr:outer membrane beta-barrel protein [[Pseudomonas] carboxydohydrogena]